MLLGADSTFWTAMAALLALGVWLIDKLIRHRERRASRRLLAQIMTTPVGIAQLDIARFKSVVLPPGGDNRYLFQALDSQEGRRHLASQAALINLELPAQFLDKADLFGEVVSNRLAMAFSEISRLKYLSQYLGEMPDSSEQNTIEVHLHAVLSQMKETEQVIDEAFQALLKESRSSIWFRRPTSARVRKN